MQRGTNNPSEYRPPILTADGTASLSQVPKDFALEWMRQNQLLPAVANKLIYISEHKDTSGAARERTGERCGMQPLIPPRTNEATGETIVDDKRWPRRRTVSSMFTGPVDETVNAEVDLA